ncbi:hypothetical protein D3C81_1694830 [compost metagenome]
MSGRENIHKIRKQITHAKPQLGRGLRLDGGKIAVFFDDLGSHRYAACVSALPNCLAARASAARKLASIHSLKRANVGGWVTMSYRAPRKAKRLQEGEVLQTTRGSSLGAGRVAR